MKNALMEVLNAGKFGFHFQELLRSICLLNTILEKEVNIKP